MGAEKKAVNLPQPNIYSYHDYREFLRDWLDFKRSSQSSFSLRFLAKSSGVAIGYINMVLSGSRNLSEKGLNKLKPHLGLSPSELSYFNQIRIIGDSSSQEERLQALSKIQRFQEYKQSNKKEVESYKYLSKWYHVAIREMASLPDFKLDATWIQNKLKVKLSIREIENAIKFLIENEFIKMDKNNKPISPEYNLNCTEGIYKLSLSQFHTHMLNLAIDSISNTPRQQRMILGHTFSVPKSKVGELNQILFDAFEKVQKLDEKSKNCDAVYHVNLNAFPLTQVLNNKDDKNEDA